MARGKILELPKTLDAGIDGAGESAHRDLEGIAGVDQERVRRGDQIVPVGGIDIGADLPRRIGLGVAEGDDLLFQPDLQPLKRHRLALARISVRDGRAGRRTAPPLRNSPTSSSMAPALPASVPLMPSWASSTLPFSPRPAQIAAQRLAQLPEIRQRGELIEGGDLVRHGGGLSGRRQARQPVRRLRSVPCRGEGAGRHGVHPLPAIAQRPLEYAM